MTFQRLIDRVLGEAKWKHAMAYLDDIVVYSNTFEDHLRDLKDVFDRLNAAGITLNAEEPQIAETRINLLGITLDCGRITPNPEKLTAIREFPAPTDVNSLRRCLGMVNFYREFIPNCASLQAPLTRLLRKTVRWSWGPEQEAAFRCTSKALEDTAELKLPDLNKPFVIQTNVSKLGLGAVLLQEHEGVLGPVAFASRSLTPAEVNYSTCEQECLDIVFALKRFDIHVDGTTFTIETDRQSLICLSRLREPAGRLARWALLLQKYDYVVRYRKGSTNVVADALSRAPVDCANLSARTQAEPMANSKPREAENQSKMEATPLTSSDENVNHIDAVSAVGIVSSKEELLKAQQNDLFCRKVIDGLSSESDSVESGGTSAGRTTGGIAVNAECWDVSGAGTDTLDQFLLNADGLLLKYIPSEKDTDNVFKVVVTKRLRCAVMRYHHDSHLAGHASGSETYTKLCHIATWPGKKRDVFRYARTCHTSQSFKPRGGKPPGLMQPIHSQEPWSLAVCDVVVPLPRSPEGHQYLLVVANHFSKWVELFPLRKLTARAITEKLMELFTRFGFAEALLADRASYFGREGQSFDRLHPRLPHIWERIAESNGPRHGGKRWGERRTLKTE
ncbi:uncharacterized protein ISCGN_004689 [Ixodes scapularis]